LERRVKGVLPKRTAKPLEVSLFPNQQWVLDFMQDRMPICLKRYRRFAIWRGCGCSITTTSGRMKVWAIYRPRGYRAKMENSNLAMSH